MRPSPWDFGSLFLLLGRLEKDWRAWLAGFCCILAGFGIIWARVLQRTLEQVAPFFRMLANQSGMHSKDIESVIFDGPAKMLRTLIGGERVNLENAMDLLSVALVHPLLVGLIGMWAIGRGTALVGELDRGTLELLLSQPVSRRMVNFSQMVFDILCWPILALALCGGLSFGVWSINPIQEKPIPPELLRKMDSARPWWLRVETLVTRAQKDPAPGRQDRMKLRPTQFLRAAPAVAGLGFALSGLSFALASFGRSRIKLLGILATVFFLMYLANLLAQLFEPMAWIRPLTVFYYYHPQEMALGLSSWVELREWGGGQVPGILVLGLVGLAGYGVGSWQMARRDLPVPV